MAINTTAVNVQQINGPGPIIGSGSMANLEQTIGIIGSGSMANLEQTIDLRITGSGSMATLTQEVVTIGSGSMANLEQRIKDASIRDNVDSQGWDLTIVIGGFIIPANQLRGRTTITKSEGDSSIAVVDLLPPTGIQNLSLYQGKSITIDVAIPSGTQRLFTGVVDIPEVDIVREFLVLSCTNRRRELINTTLGGIAPTIGYYSDQVFSEAKDTAQLLEQRLETIPQALDFDSYNNHSFTPWLPKGTPDFTLDDPDVFIKEPRVEVASRGRVVNQVAINVEYRFERNYHMDRAFSWESPIKDSVCLMLRDGYTLTHRAMVDEAVKAAGWPLKGLITYSPTPSDGWYRCDGVTIGFTTQSHTVTTAPKVDGDGDPVLDSDGNQIQEDISRITTDLAPVFTTGASWRATTRWSQTISENYSVIVKAPQSIAQYGTVETDESHGVEDSFDSGEWENYSAYNDNSLGLNYFINRNDDIATFNNAFTTILNRAKTTILGSHRDNRVIVSGHYQAGKSPIWPQLELRHTVSVTADKLAAKGKVFKITHEFDCGTTEAMTTIELALSQSIGSTSDTALTLPSRPSDSPTIPSGIIRLGNHFGEDPTTDAAKSWTGYIGNAWVSGHRTQYQQGFVVDTPAISSELRDSRELNASVSYDVVIPNDTLTITFDGKLKI